MIVFIITAAILVFYLMYPLWLYTNTKMHFEKDKIDEIKEVTLVYLSQNSDVVLNEKVNFLLQEISNIENSELIVIDDGSSDSSQQILKSIQHPKLNTILKEASKGIPDSMNAAVHESKYKIVVFCDQRQKLEEGIILKLIQPLRYFDVGAVSSCVSCKDKKNSFSLLRFHENSIKKNESNLGSLMGVYGPLYAIKKELYTNIPDEIILDDLYLTLNILKSKKVIFLSDCIIKDENISILYDFKRTKRYLQGFFQLLKHKNLIKGISNKHLFMLIWHKYVRLFIPTWILICYLTLAYKSVMSYSYLWLFILSSVLIIVSLLPVNIKFFNQLNILIRITIFYSVATTMMLFKKLLFIRQK